MSKDDDIKRGQLVWRDHRGVEWQLASVDSLGRAIAILRPGANGLQYRVAKYLTAENRWRYKLFEEPLGARPMDDRTRAVGGIFASSRAAIDAAATRESFSDAVELPPDGIKLEWQA